MALASSSRSQLRYILESTFGTTPGAGNGSNLRMTGESLAFQLQTETSKEIRSDRQTTDNVPVGASAQGGFNFEFSYKEYDALLEAALQGTWAVYGTNGVGSTFTADFTATTITASIAPTGNNAFTTLAQGQWFKLTAPGHANDGKYFQVHASTAPTSTVITVSANTPLTVGSTIANCAVATSRLVNGTTQRSFTVEKEFADVAQFFAYRGMTPSKLSLNFASGAIVNGSLEFLGKDAVRSGTTTLPGSPVASAAYDVMNAVSGVGQVMENDTLLAGTFIRSLGLEYDNKLRGQTAIGTLGNVGIGSGTIDVGASIEIYLADGTMYDKFIANTATSLSWRSVDGAGNGYVFTLPKVKFSDMTVVAGAIDQDIVLSGRVVGLMDATSGKSLMVDRVGVAIA